jgi:hypothetical protein
MTRTAGELAAALRTLAAAGPDGQTGWAELLREAAERLERVSSSEAMTTLPDHVIDRTNPWARELLARMEYARTGQLPDLARERRVLLERLAAAGNQDAS